MDKTTQEDIEKFAYIMRLLRTLYLATNEDISDHPMRILMRYVFVQVDNLEKMAGRLKNRLVSSRHLQGNERAEVEAAIRKLLSSYNNSLDVVRDKVAAHGQQIELETFLDYWCFIDASSIDILYDDAFALEQAFRKCRLVDFAQLGGDFSPVLGVDGSPLKEAGSIPILAADRAGLQRPNAAAIIPPMNPAMEATQLSVSIVDALLIDFQISALVDDPGTIYTKHLFDIAWFMAITDTCSLIDTLFEDGPKCTSVITLWNDEEIEGTPVLRAIGVQRNKTFEERIRHVRNRLAAHIDDKDPLEFLFFEYENVDLQQVHSYAIALLQGFQRACMVDMRTRLFALHGKSLPNAHSVPKITTPFRA